MAVRRCIAMLAVAISGSAVAAEAPALTSGPKVTSRKGGALIQFTVDRPTDVAIDIQDAEGKIVRHLGAAALGAKKPPPPFQAGTLSQKVLWDKRDDTGKPVRPGRYSVRLRLGLQASFDRFLGRENGPNLAAWHVVGIAVDSDGSVFVLLNDMFWTQCQTRVCVFSREGKYLRTVLPYRATTSPDKLRGVDFLSAERNRLLPRIYCHLCGHMLPYTRGLRPQTPVMTRDGRLVMVGGYAGELFGWGPRCLLAIHRDGTVPRERIDGPVIAEGCVGGSVSLALSPDERSVYLTGLQDGRYGLAKHARHVVYKVGLGVNDKPTIFVGELKKPGSDETHLNVPRGIASDPDGNVYVADSRNDRIVVYSPAGRFLAQMKLPAPNYVLVHPKTRAIYATSGSRKRKVPGRIVKFSRLREPKIVWEWKGRVPQDAVLGLDPHAEKPILYFGSPRGLGLAVRRLLDTGKACKDMGEIPAMRGGGGLAWYAHIYGIQGEALYVKDHRTSWVYNGATGKRTRFWARYYDRLFLGRDGYIYMPRPGGKWLKAGAIERVDYERKPVPFSATGPRAEPYYYFWLGRKDDIWITASGDIYLFELGRKPANKSFGGRGEAVLSVIGRDGKFKKRRLIATFEAPVGIRVDSRGNIYVADNLKPPGKYYPEQLAPIVESWRDKEGLGARAEYAALYGTILKFSPKGGTIRRLEKGEAAPVGEGYTVLEQWLGQRKFVAEGLTGCYLGISPLPPSRSVLPNCFCNAASFDLDSYDRLFVPDAARFCVHVLDASFNPILDFGSYDSIDSKGGQANAPGPEIPLACYRDMEVRASDEACYVVDRPNQRIVRVRLHYKAEGMCQVAF